jgi:hypothetical protein
MVNELIEMYQDGGITGYQVMMDCLQILDPDHPDLVLRQLPEEILEEMLEYAQRYDPSCMRSIAGLPPAADQVRAAQRWIEGKRQNKGAEERGTRNGGNGDIADTRAEQSAADDRPREHGPSSHNVKPA